MEGMGYVNIMYNTGLLKLLILQREKLLNRPQITFLQLLLHLLE